MKKLKNILSLSIVALCAFCILGAADVFALAGANNFRVACESSTIEKGDTTNCYILAQVTNDATTGAGIDGVMARIKEIKNLEIVGDPLIAPAKNADMLAERISKTQKVQGDSTAKAATYECGYDSCDMFYAKGSSTVKLKAAESWSDNNVSEITGFSAYTVLGRYKVKLQESATMTECGKLCLDIMYSAGGDYSASGFGTGGAPCTEIKPLGAEPQPGNPGSGSFTSYIVLIGGAFLACGAIALARKNNKFYRV